MKKIFLFLILSFSMFGIAQEKEKVDFPKTEIKGNSFFLVLGAVEVTYERILNEDSGLGVALFFVNEEDFDTSFSLTPYYRAYFGKKPAAGFFVEGFSMLSTGIHNKTYYFNNSGNLINIISVNLW